MLVIDRGQVPGVGEKALGCCHWLVRRHMMSLFSQFHCLCKVLRADFEAGFEAMVNVSKRGVELSQNLGAQVLDLDGEKGTDQARSIAEQGQTLAHQVLHSLVAAEEGDEASIE